MKNLHIFQKVGINVNRNVQIPIHGTLGVFQHLSGWFIVIITENTIIGEIEENQICLASKFQIHPIPQQIQISDEEV